tara:strand:- start:352 stop:615 length:264 start_codon:yes stop_codon:yes gene_type:complete
MVSKNKGVKMKTKETYTAKYRYRYENEIVESPTIHFMNLKDRKLTDSNIVEEVKEYIFDKGLDEIVGLTMTIFRNGIDFKTIRIVNE